MYVVFGTYEIGNLIKYLKFCPRSFFQLVGDLSELREKDYTDLQHSPGTRSLYLSFFLSVTLPLYLHFFVFVFLLAYVFAFVSLHKVPVFL